MAGQGSISVAEHMVGGEFVELSMTAEAGGQYDKWGDWTWDMVSHCA